MSTTLTDAPLSPGRPAGRPWTMAELSQHSTLSERHLRRLVAAGELRIVRFGRKITIPDAEVARFLREGTR